MYIYGTYILFYYLSITAGNTEEDISGDVSTRGNQTRVDVKTKTMCWDSIAHYIITCDLLSIHIVVHYFIVAIFIDKF